MANLVASTSGTDSDWVVKLIDVYPPEAPGHPELGGYQLAVAMDIFRGRYRESLETPKAIAAGQPLLYKFALPDVNHVFLPGHRIMVQVQSTCSRSTTAIRRRSWRTSSTRSRGITAKPRSASTTRRTRRASSSSRWLRRYPAEVAAAH